jgi:hypothetical protein
MSDAGNWNEVGTRDRSVKGDSGRAARARRGASGRGWASGWSECCANARTAVEAEPAQPEENHPSETSAEKNCAKGKIEKEWARRHAALPKEAITEKSRRLAAGLRFTQDYGNKKGRASEVRMNNIETRQGSRPDLTTRSGRSVELKPSTVSGRKAMGKQLPRYETTMNRRGIRVYYDQRGERRFERTPYHEWRMRGESKPRLCPAP